MNATDTVQLILDTEAKVALQWAGASGNTLAHSQGFSFRRSTGCKPLSPVAASTQRIVRPRRPTPNPRGGSLTLVLLILLVLVLGLGIGTAAQSKPAEPPPPAPRLW